VSKPKKFRVDNLLVERELAENRTRAQALIMAGLVFTENECIEKPGRQLPADVPLRVKGRDHPWVSRGGIKLDHALKHFKISTKGTVCVDVGASTGGFTDVLLRAGAKHVYAIDVGHGQFDWKLRNDPRVVLLEKTNARHLDRKLVPEAFDLLTCDASFIGLRTVLPAAMALSAPGARLIALIKPQFEVGRGLVGKGGVVRDPEQHQRVCNEIENWLAGQPRWSVLGVTESPITGPGGNREFLICGQRDSAGLDR